MDECNLCHQEYPSGEPHQCTAFAPKTKTCSHCKLEVDENEIIQTCDAYRRLDLCPDCYKKSGNSVR